MSVRVRYIGGILPDIILLTQCYYHRGTRLNAIRRTHHRLLLRVIGYHRRERGTYRQLSYAQALKKTWVSKRGSYHSTTATSVRGSHGQTTRRAPPEAADGRKTSRGGEIQARDARSRIGWIVSRTTSKRSEPQTALRWTTGSHSELAEPYRPLRRRLTMGRRGTRGC